MEFRFRAGDVRPVHPATSIASAVTVPYSYLTMPAVREDFLGAAGEVGRTSIARSVSLMNPIQRSIEKKRIREEMYVRDVVERRMLEEEVRRELEMERFLGIGRHSTEWVLRDRNTMASIVSGTTLADARGVCRLNGASQSGFYGARSLEALPQWNGMWNFSAFTVEMLDHTKSHSPSNVQVRQSNNKRKAAIVSASNKVPKLLPKEWSCALCQITATTEKNLNDHLDGKKHKSKLAVLGHTEKEIKSNSESIFLNQTRGVNEEHKTSMIQVDGKMQSVVKKGIYLWCELCEMKCDSSNMLMTHLHGKKHCAEMKLKSEQNPSPAVTNTCNTKPQKTDSEELPNVVKKGNYLWCKLCNLECNSSVVMTKHLSGKKHHSLMKLQKAIGLAKLEKVPSPGGPTTCKH
ncbi:uncharacterized protein LOC141820087 [Curcuma longa]|uniref:uncharacterized protein LOC141820087 n=1 Tax=Curcuma longa TaxID=136217 RepID=UPI003D9E4C0E